jgi:hypothetical protein
MTAAISSALLLAACGSDADSGSADDAETVGTGAAANDAEPNDAEPDDAETVGTETAPDEPADPEANPESEDNSDDAPATGQGTATLTLDNGETLQFDVACTLEPQIAAGSEILFTATSLSGDIRLDITQFGDEGPVTDIASITVFDGASFEALWGASDTYEPFGGSLELEIDGSTISGAGDFYAGDDPIEGGDPVAGNVIANC